MKKCLNMCKMHRFGSSCTCVKYHPDLCSPLIHSVGSNYSISGQWRPWSDCASAQSDLGLHCPHMIQRDISAWWGSDIVCNKVPVLASGSKPVRSCFQVSHKQKDMQTDVRPDQSVYLCSPDMSIPFTVRAATSVTVPSDMHLKKTQISLCSCTVWPVFVVDMKKLCLLK